MKWRCSTSGWGKVSISSPSSEGGGVSFMTYLQGYDNVSISSPSSEGGGWISLDHPTETAGQSFH